MFTTQTVGNFDFLQSAETSPVLGEEGLNLETLVQDDGFEMPPVGKVRISDGRQAFDLREQRIWCKTIYALYLASNVLFVTH